MLFDGGIRTGADIMRALVLGARACMIGRAYIYGLGAGGPASPRRSIFSKRNSASPCALTGSNRIADIDGRVLVGAEAKKKAARSGSANPPSSEELRVAGVSKDGRHSGATPMSGLPDIGT